MIPANKNDDNQITNVFIIHFSPPPAECLAEIGVG